MNRKPLSSFAVVALIAAGVAVFAWSREDRPRSDQYANRHARLMEERLAALDAPQQALAKALAPLHDSLRLAMGDYVRKVRDGAAPRTLVAERARIAKLRSEIARLEAADPEVTLDLLAQLPPFPPGPMRPGFGKHPCAKDGDSTKPHCSRHPPMPQAD